MDLGPVETCEPGRYQATDSEQWSRLAPRKGQVLICRIPIPLATEDAVDGAFVIIQRSLMSDGSLDLLVKSLGSSSQKTTGKLSSLFNRKEGHIHLCMLAGLCPVSEGSVFHCQQLQLFEGADFGCDFVGATGKRLLKQVLQDMETDEIPWEKLPDLPAGEHERGLYSPERLEEPQAPEGTGDGGRSPTQAIFPGRGAVPKEARPSGVDLRERLERVKRRELEKGTDHPPLPPEKENAPALESPWEGGVPPHLRSGQKLWTAQEEINAMLRQAQSAGRNQEAVPKEHTTPTWMTSSSVKGVGGQLALRAAATTKGLRPPPPGGGSGGNSGEKKRKKKGKKKKKKKKGKKKKRKRSPGGGDPGDGPVVQAPAAGICLPFDESQITSPARFYNCC